MGSHFYWMCNWTTIKEVLDYDGSIVKVYWWVHTIISYPFNAVHIFRRMMVNIDALACRFGRLIAIYYVIPYIFAKRDQLHRPTTYSATSFRFITTTKFASNLNLVSSMLVLATAYIDSHSSFKTMITPYDTVTTTIITSPILLLYSSHKNSEVFMHNLRLQIRVI